MADATFTTWSFPNRVLSGPGAADHTGAELAAMDASRILLVTDRATLDGGLVEEIGTSLKKAKLAYEVFAGAGPVARERPALAALTAYRDAEADGVVAVGGEGALEIAKILRLGLRTSEGLDAWLGAEERPVVRRPLPPLVAVPTLPGSGAEVRARASLSREADDGPVLLDLPELRPEVAILDPRTVAGASPTALAEGAFDALAWATEGLANAGDHPAAAALGALAVERLSQLLQRVPEIETVGLEEAGAWLEVAYLAALAGDAGEGACRSLTRALVGTLDVSSGLAAALTLPAVLDYNRSARPERLALVAAALGARGDDVETLAFEAAGAVRALRRSSGLPEGLEAAGLEEEAIPAVAARAAGDSAHLDNPRSCSENDLLALLRAAW